MKCAVHPDLDAAGYCRNCGKAISCCGIAIPDTGLRFTGDTAEPRECGKPGARVFPGISARHGRLL